MRYSCIKKKKCNNCDIYVPLQMYKFYFNKERVKLSLNIIVIFSHFERNLKVTAFGY